MAPRKEKVEKVSADAANDMVLQYLKRQNRPYSATDVSANLHNKVSKAAAQKILKSLTERKEIEERVAGKQSVFHAIQDPEEAPTAEEFAEMDARTKELCEETNSLNATLKSLRSTFSTLNSTLSTADLRESVTVMESERVQIIERLTLLRSGAVQPVSKAEKEQVDKDLKKWERTANARKRIAKEIWAQVSDGLPGAAEVAELKENLGLEDI